MKRTSRKPKKTSRNPSFDTKLYSVVDRMTGFERRHLTKEQARQTLEAHTEQCSRYGWRHEARVYYRDGTDVTREFLGGSMDRNPRLTESQRAKLPLSVFVFPERRAFPLESETAAYDAIRMLRLGRVKSASDFKAVTDAIRREYPAAWKKYGAGLSWSKTKAAKALGSKRRAATVAKKRTSRMAANPEWTTGAHFPEFKTRDAAEEWAKSKIKGQPWKVFSLRRLGGSRDRTVWKAYVQKGYAFRNVERNPEATANGESRKVPAAVEKAVKAARLYHGSSGCLVRDQQKLYTKMRRALDAVTQKYGDDAERQILGEATRLGAILPVPGKDI